MKRLIVTSLLIGLASMSLMLVLSLCGADYSLASWLVGWLACTFWRHFVK